MGGVGSALEEFGDGFGAGADLEFFVNAADVGVDGFVADAEFIGDFLVKEPLREAIEDFLFAWGEIFRGLRGGADALEGLDDFTRDVSGHG